MVSKPGEFENEYQVTEESVQEHAKTVFEAIHDLYESIHSISQVFPNKEYCNSIISGLVTKYGVLPNAEVNYEPSLLNNKDFRLAVIFHLCLSDLCGKDLTWTEYTEYLNIMEVSINDYSDNRPEPISAQSIILNGFCVDPACLPEQFRLDSSAIDEVNRAATLICEECNKLKKITEDFQSYDAYMEYIRHETNRITMLMLSKGFPGSHDLEHFSVLICSKVNGLPLLDVPYRSPRMEPSIKEEVEGLKQRRVKLKEAMVKIQRAVFKMMGIDVGPDDVDTSGIIDLGGDPEDD